MPHYAPVVPRTLGALRRAVRQKKLVTTAFQVDNNGNVVEKLTDGVLTTYQWDYANRLIALGVNNASTTYGYDAFGARV